MGCGRVSAISMRCGVQELTAEAVEDFLGEGMHRKGEDQHLSGIAAECMRARKERQPSAEAVHSAVVMSHSAVFGERDLVRPVSIHHRFAELVFTIDHRPLRKWSPPALDAT